MWSGSNADSASVFDAALGGGIPAAAASAPAQPAAKVEVVKKAPVAKAKPADNQPLRSKEEWHGNTAITRKRMEIL